MTARFISLDGIDGAGKSAQIGRLADWLRGRGQTVTTCRDPGSTPVGDAVRAILAGKPVGCFTIPAHRRDDAAVIHTP